MALRVCGACFVAGERLKGEYVLDRGNSVAEPTRIPADWIDTVPLHHDEIRNKGGARNQEKKYLASRDSLKSKGWTSLA